MPMAAQYVHSPLSNRHTNDEEQRLPTGRCNFTNLSNGANAPICGCRRFWDKALGTPGLGAANGTGFCMCEHHACFHDEAPEGESGTPRLMSAARTPRIQRSEEVGRPQDSVPDTLPWGRYINSGSSAGLPAIPSQCLLPSETDSVTSGSQSRYSKPFGGLGLNTLSHIPKPGALTRIAEVSKKQLFEDRNGNAHLQSLTEVATPSIQASQEPEADFEKTIASAQEILEKIAEGQSQKAVALRACKDGASFPIKQSGSNPGMGSLTTAPSELGDGVLIPRLRNIVNTLAEYPARIKNHEQRLGQLENGSFTHGAIEDLQDADDRLDTRCGDLEEAMREIERVQTTLNNMGSVCDRHVNASFSSRASESSSAMIASAIDSSRIEALEAQVAELQASALPSRARPWEVEVVFLPYGSRLMGIWSSQHIMSQRSRLNSTAPDEWTQTQHQHNSIAAVAQACLKDHEGVSAWERSATNLADDEEDDQPDWFSARACGPRSRVDERLRSRGLVKKIEITGADARDVQAAITQAFEDLPETLNDDPFTDHDENTGTVPKSLKQYLALSASWIPLRKLHKNSVLRFLTPSEMITPALWTAPFLKSSVLMRSSGGLRLYVTHRDAYIQHISTQNSDWTWQKLRQLPRFYPDQTSTPPDAHEPCWEFDDRLDPPEENTSLHSSFESQLSIDDQPFEVEREPMSPSDHFSSAPPTRGVSTTPTSVVHAAPPLSPLKERNPFRPVRHERTVSMPTLVPIRSSQSGPTTKRRITSFDHEEIRSSPTPHPLPAPLNLANPKRLRTRSPSRPRDTPRWSIGPPSPYDAGGMRERGLTPFAYATPHSNAPYLPRGEGSEIGIYEDEDDAEYIQRPRTGGSTTEEEWVGEGGAEENALSDFDDGQGRNMGDTEEGEWEGVQDHDGFGEDGDGGEGDSGEESEVPSEYPSKQRDVEEFRGVKTEKGFRIHVDLDVDEEV